MRAVFESATELDTEVALLSEKLASYNPDALIEMKKNPLEGHFIGKHFWKKERLFRDNWSCLVYQKRFGKNLKNKKQIKTILGEIIYLQS